MSEINQQDADQNILKLSNVLSQRGLTKASVKHLKELFTSEEVLRSIKSLKSGKSPGPDGLGIEIYKSLGITATGVLAKVFIRLMLSGGKSTKEFINGIIILLLRRETQHYLRILDPSPC